MIQLHTLRHFWHFDFTPEKENFPSQMLYNLLLAPSVEDLHITSPHGNCRSSFQTSGFTALGQNLKENLAFVIS